MVLDAAEIVAIHQLYARYNHAVDAGDGGGFAALFTAGGSVDIMGNHVEGRDGLAAFARGVPEQVPGIRHIASNIVATGDGDDRALGAAYLVTYVASGDGLRVLIAGKYTDTLERVGGEWRFSSRQFIPDPTPDG